MENKTYISRCQHCKKDVRGWVPEGQPYAIGQCPECGKEMVFYRAGQFGHYLTRKYPK